MTAEAMSTSDLDKPTYGSFDRLRSLAQVDLMAQLDPELEPIVQERARQFVELTFDRWEGLEPVPEASFAFLVPARLQRHNPLHLNEMTEFMPPAVASAELGQAFLAGLPPFIVDRYERPVGSGVMLYTPVLLDIFHDLAVEQAMDVLRHRVVEAITFARRFGVELLGLAATLPSLSRFGRAVAVDGVTTTTGHAGTAAIVLQLIDNLIHGGEVDPERKPYGLIGCGSIGTAFTVAIAARHPRWPVMVADERPERAERTITMLAEYGVAAVSDTASSVLESCDLVISAVTTPLDLDALGIGERPELVVIDDSQPSAFDRAQMAKRGGRLLWPLAEDRSQNGLATRIGVDGRLPYTYGGYPIGFTSGTQLFGCEAEVSLINHFDRSDLALDHHIAAQDVAHMDDLMKQGKVTAADLSICRRI